MNLNTTWGYWALLMLNQPQRKSSLWSGEFGWRVHSNNEKANSISPCLGRVQTGTAVASHFLRVPFKNLYLLVGAIPPFKKFIYQGLVTEKLQINQLLDHLFRHETGKLVSVLTRIFGSDHLELAEDVVQDSLIEAVSRWEIKGMPENPSAWLFRVAKNKALNILNREKYKKQYLSDVAHFLQSEWTTEAALSHLFSEQEIQDDQLKMIFTCCHPCISADSQIALALKTLCGFSIAEIAKAFLTTEENIHKRLVRARQKIRDDKIGFEVPIGGDLEKRLITVLETIYLLFNEGYSASKGSSIIRYELCQEAIRLTEMIAADRTIQGKGNVFALLSLMYLNASRFEARQDSKGNLLTMEEQDRTIWDNKMINKGLSCLQEATKNGDLSIYHILAAISAEYCIAPAYESTDWRSILSLYDHLMQMGNSALVLLNRAIAVSKVKGAEKALDELKMIRNDPSIKSNYLYYSTEGELFIQLRDYASAVNSFEKAIRLAPLKPVKALLEKRLIFCRRSIN